jgi:YidC/Oxa1 family membrane protein insertase
MLNPNFFNTIFVFPILNLLILIYKGLLIIKIPGALGFAIILLTVIIRGAFNPFFKSQMLMSKKMSDIKPELDRLTAKYKNDQKQLQQEQLKLYKEAGINPASGCLFMIIQIPIFLALYQTLNMLLVNNGAKMVVAINKVLYSKVISITSINPWFFGLNLALTPKQGGHFLFLLVPLLTGFLQYLQAQSMAPATTPATSAIETKDGDKKSNTGDFQKAMNTQMKYLFPIMIGWFSYTLPIGLSIYWNVFSLFSIIQYKQMNPKLQKSK